MTNYDDDAVGLDEHGLTIKNYLCPAGPRVIAYDRIDCSGSIERCPS